MTPEKALDAVAKVGNVVLAIVGGEYLKAAEQAADLMLDLAPHDAAKVLSEATMRRINAEAEAAEIIKFAELDDPAYDADDPTNPGAE